MNDNPLNVRVYTSGDQVKLLLNGKEIETKSVLESAKLLAVFKVRYAEGELRAIAYKDGKEIASQTLKTVGNPTSLRLQPDRAKIPACRNDLAYVTVDLVDAAGNQCLTGFAPSISKSREWANWPRRAAPIPKM